MNKVYLDEHLKKYPLMQLEDVLKLYLQGILGPAHLVSSFENCLSRVTNEYNSITHNQYNDIEEVISDEYVRVYIYPYYQQEKDFTLLIRCFIESSKEVGDIDYFKKKVSSLVNNDNEEYIKQYLSSNNYLVSHSQIYKDAYDPHYLVIHKKYLHKIYHYKNK